MEEEGDDGNHRPSSPVNTIKRDKPVKKGPESIFEAYKRHNGFIFFY